MTWHDPENDQVIRKEASRRIAQIMTRGIGEKSRDQRREYRVLLALEKLCYENAKSKEEYTDPRSFKIVLHRMAAEKAKRRRNNKVDVESAPKEKIAKKLPLVNSGSTKYNKMKSTPLKIETSGDSFHEDLLHQCWTSLDSRSPAIGRNGFLDQLSPFPPNLLSPAVLTHTFASPRGAQYLPSSEEPEHPSFFIQADDEEDQNSKTKYYYGDAVFMGNRDPYNGLEPIHCYNDSSRAYDDRARTPRRQQTFGVPTSHDQKFSHPAYRYSQDERQ